MKFIVLLAGLLIVGLLVKKQFGSSPLSISGDTTIDSKHIHVPKVPTSPKEVRKFKKEINEMVDNNTATKMQAIEEAVGK